MSERQFNYPPRSGKRRNGNADGTTLRDVNAAERVKNAIKFKLEGMNWDEVAAHAGYASRGAAHHAVMREYDRCITPGAQELRQEQLYMIKALQAKCYKAAMDPSNEYWYWSADRVVNYSKRISELMGLDTPVDSTINNNFTIVREVPQGWLAPVEAQP